MVLPTRPENWVPSSGIILETNAEIAVRSNFNSVVIAGPGAGKTELLAQRACFLLQTGSCRPPKRILAISFKKDASTNLAERVEKRCGKALAQRFDSFTYDAFAKLLVDRFLNALPSDYKPARNYEIIFPDADKMQELIYQFQIPSEWSDRTVDEIHARKLLSHFCRRPLPLNNNLTFEDWAASEVWQKWLNNPGLSLLTFQMISRLAEYLLRENPLLLKTLQLTYSHVFLDEFQDTTYIQYDLLRTAFINSQATFTAVGDTKQRIMGWAGAVPGVFNIYCTDFGARRLDLTRNHRSAPLLINIQTALSVQLDPESLAVVPSENWATNEGLCQVHLFDNFIQEADIIANEINELIIHEQLDPRKIVILAKQHVEVYAKELIKQLDQLGRKARVESDLQDLLVEPLTQIILRFFRLAILIKAPEDWQAIVELLIDLRGYRNEEKPEKIIGVERDLDQYIQNVRNELNNLSMTACSPQIIMDTVYGIITFLGEHQLKNHFSQYKRDDWFSKVLTGFSTILAQEYKDSGAWKRTLDNFIGKDTIPIMTIHKSKGLEYDVVIFIGLEDGAFWNFVSQPHEDTCAFFVALSRAKRKVYFTFSNIRRTRRGNSREGRNNIKSLYDILTKSGVEVVDHRN